MVFFYSSDRISRDLIGSRYWSRCPLSFRVEGGNHEDSCKKRILFSPNADCYVFCPHPRCYQVKYNQLTSFALPQTCRLEGWPGGPGSNPNSPILPAPTRTLKRNGRETHQLSVSVSIKKAVNINLFQLQDKNLETAKKSAY